MANRIDETFRRLRAEGRKAFMPFLTAGDPDLETTAALIKEVAARGASMIELGLPYSDPVADGPTIQASYTRSIEAGTTLSAIFDMVAGLRKDCDLPIAGMGSFSLVMRRGVEQFVADAKAAGLDGLIIPDLPLEEYQVIGDLAEQADLAHIMLIAPTSPWDRARSLAEASTGFVYTISVAGITGERDALPPELSDRVAKLRGVTDVPICVGFGISKPEHVAAVTQVADGVIVGSAIVRRINDLSDQPRDALVSSVSNYVADLVAALP
jgi:tryptophan synthase alpha chain